MKCPKCRRTAYVVCGNSDCKCAKAVPKNKKPLEWTSDGEGQICPYCGFTASADWWEERWIETHLPAHKTS